MGKLIQSHDCEYRIISRFISAAAAAPQQQQQRAHRLFLFVVVRLRTIWPASLCVARSPRTTVCPSCQVERL